MDEARKKRAAALEEKRKRLEEMRKKRAEREGAGGAGAGSASSAAEGGNEATVDGQNINDYINSLLAAPPPPSVAQAGTSAQPPQPPPSDNQVDGSLTEPAVPRDSAASGNKATASSASDEQPRPPPQLTIVTGLGKINITPTAPEFYHKATQTDDALSPSPGHTRTHTHTHTGGWWSNEAWENGPMSPRPDSHASPPPSHASRRRASGLLGGGRHVTHLFTPEDVSALTGADGMLANALSPTTTKPPVKKSLSDEEKAEVMKEAGFVDFVMKSSLVVERLLARDETYNVFVDYGAGDGDRKRRDTETITRLSQFHDEKHCADRPVMDVHWSPHYSELFLAAYNTTASHASAGMADGAWGMYAAGGSGAQWSNAGGEPDGLVLVWSLALPSRPEFTFKCQAPVLTARFHDHDAHLIVGGTYSGQIVLWDTRAKSLPVQRTPLSASGHTHPVYSLALAPTVTHTHTTVLVSASSDGRVCTWNLAQLNQPIETTEVVFDPDEGLVSPGGAYSARRGRRPVPITAFAFDHDKGSEELLLGSESGHLYTVALHGGSHSASHRPTSAAVVRQYEAHFGLVTSLARHPRTPSKAISPLLLSASVDWSMRLWDLSKSSDPLAVFHHGTYDYVSDVKWCPTHPAVFTSITSGGDLYVWNLNSSLEVPVGKPFAVSATDKGSGITSTAPSGTNTTATTTSSSNSSSSGGRGGGKAALTRMAWSNEGHKIAVGDSRGVVHVLSVAEEVVKARMDEELRLETTLALRSGATESTDDIDTQVPREEDGMANGPISASSPRGSASPRADRVGAASAAVADADGAG